MKLELGAEFVAHVAGANQDQLNRFGLMMGTAGRIHTDPHWAATSPAGGVLVQGGLVMAPLHEMMVHLVGAEKWLSGSHILIKIVSFTRPNEPITIYAVVTEVGSEYVRFSVSWKKEDGQTVMVADTYTKN